MKIFKNSILQNISHYYLTTEYYLIIEQLCHLHLYFLIIILTLQNFNRIPLIYSLINLYPYYLNYIHQVCYQFNFKGVIEYKRIQVFHYI